MSKYEDTRIVYFTEDYAVNGRVFYKKGSTHAIHKTVADKLVKAGAKCKVDKLDSKKAEEEKKVKLGKQRKKAIEMSYQE